MEEFKKNFIKVLAIANQKNSFDFFENFQNFCLIQHNQHILYAGKGKSNLIIKQIFFQDIESENYSLKKFSSYDVIWIIEQDYLLLKKTLDKYFENLPTNIPKLAIVTQNGESESNIQFFDKFCLYKIISLKKLQKQEYQQHITNASYTLLNNPKQGLTEDFYLRHKPSQIGIGVPFILATVAVIGLVIGYKYKKELKRMLHF